MFRFLRDMSLGIQAHQSTSLIDAMTIGLARTKNFYGAPPVTAARQKAGSSSLHLEHPGAVLCMVDLLPAVGVDEAFADDADLPEKVSGMKSVIDAKDSVAPFLSPDNRNENVSDLIDNRSSSSVLKKDKKRKKHELKDLDMERRDLEKEVVEDGCHMTKTEAKTVRFYTECSFHNQSFL